MKKILMVGMNFYTYEEKIEQTLKEMGYLVDKITDKKKEPRGYNTFAPKFVKEHDIVRHQKKLMKKINNNYDIILVFVGRYLKKFFLDFLKKTNPNAKFILYLWDDLGRVENFEAVKEYYDEIITFELNDAIKYKFRFIPLYFTDDFIIFKNEKKKYDICTVSAKHSDRIKIAKQLVDSNPGDIIYKLCIFVGIIPYFKYIINGEKKKYEKKGLYFCKNKLSIRETAKIMSESIAVLDIPHFTQKGLSSRTLEALGSRIKLITTNEQVKYYDFYNENNIYILNRNNPVIDSNFLKTTLVSIDDRIINKYSLKNWLEMILSGEKYNFLNKSFDEIKKEIDNDC